jgi:sigma-E factor negative regulatory protein RseA
MKETVSALYDGELDATDMERMCARLKDEPELREAWDTYSLIGDALRGNAGGSLPVTFSGRLAAEPTVLAPRPSVLPMTPRRATRVALSAAAGVAAIAFVGMMAFPMLKQENVVPPMATATTGPLQQQQATSTAVAAAAVAQPPQRANAVASPAVRDYLLAHQRFSPALALQGAAPFVRTVSDEPGTGGR